MKPLLAIALSLLLTQAARGESFTLRIQETASVEISGATAAYTTNPAIADVTIQGVGHISLTGHSPGTTQLMVITDSGTQSFLITVAPSSQPSSAPPKAGAPLARYDGRYSSGASQVQNAFGLVTKDGDRRSELFFLHIHDLHDVEDETADTIASLFYRRTTPRGELTLLDEMVDVSRMTVSNTQVRGLHLRQGPLELHGGYASSTMYDGLFLSGERRWVAGAGYDIDYRSARWTPSVYGFFSEPEGTAAQRGVVGALTVEHRRGDTLFVRGDIGVSSSVAAAGELRYTSSRGQFRAFFSLKPDDFPTVGLADAPGDHVELDWNRRATDRLSITSHGTYDRFNLSASGQSLGSASFGLRYALTRGLSVFGGADVSEIRTPATSIRTIGLPLGITYDASAFGLAASYRLLDNSETSRRGDTLRLSARAGRGRFSVNAWAERQRRAPTLDLIFREEPGLELALLRLGISVRTPEELARALRDNFALIDLGYITGVNVQLAPNRMQAGFNVGWLGSGQRSDHFRLLTVYSRDEGIRATSDSLIATLTYSRRFLAATDVYGSYSWWRQGVLTQQEDGTSLEIGLRQQFTPGLPRFLQRSGTIEGFAFLDPEMLGVQGPSTTPLPGIAVLLDGTLTARTDASGAYVFRKVPPGQHRIAAQLPASASAFFTTPSHAETNGSARVDFGLVWAGARIDGRVLSDAGVGIPGAALSATGATGAAMRASSDSEGRFLFAVPPGAFRVALAGESLPNGYVIDGNGEQGVSAVPDQPVSLAFEVRALRSVAGRAEGASEVRIEPLGRTAPVDAEGNFVFRSMPSGTFTITARVRGRAMSGAVTLPAEPTMMRDVVLGASQPAVASSVSPSPPPASRRSKPPEPPPNAPLVRHDGAFRVAVGAFRLQENAAAAGRRLEGLGRRAEITLRDSLYNVTVGPFASHEAAEAEAALLATAGVNAVVVTARATSPATSPPSNGSYVVQMGAFREYGNATQLVARLQRSGEQPFTAAGRGLTLVYIGPFEAWQDAVAASERLRRAGFGGFATRR